MSAVKVARELMALARAEGRDVLLETEVYQVLDAAGLRVPLTLAVQPGERISQARLDRFKGDEVLLKVASPRITHKSDLGGVLRVPRTVDGVAEGSRAIEEAVRERGGDELAGSIAWIQVTELVSGLVGLGGELFVGLRGSREFGPALVAGFGGLDTEALAERFRSGIGTALAPAGLVDAERFLGLFKRTFAWEKISGAARGAVARVEEDALLAVFQAFLELADGLGSEGETSLLDLEINPFFVTDSGLVAVDGFLRFGPGPEGRNPPPLEPIGNLLEPRTVALVGVSAKGMNIGRVILRNLLREDFPLEDIRILRPGGGEIDGVQCVGSPEELPWVADLLVVAVAADQVPPLLAAVVDGGRARSVVLIPGGMDETEGGKEAAAAARATLDQARSEGRPSPVLVGPNCLGIRSRPGRYDTLFIPESKLPLPEPGGVRDVALVFQSGAFMITRMNELPHLDPTYAISTGNQMDLTTTDFVRHLAGDERIRVIGLYIEGYGDLEGLECARAIRAARERGRTVVAYKAGRTMEGRTATSSHTASMAGDYAVARAALKEAGALVAETFDEFRELIMLASLLGDRPAAGRRLALMSNAGFETVGMADNVRSGFSLARYRQDTLDRVTGVLEQAGIARLINVGNPLDLTPMAPDAVHADCLQAVADDPETDAVVMGFVPLTPAMATLPPGASERDNIELSRSLAKRLPEILRSIKKPVVTIVDGGRIYDPLADALLLGRVPCFRSADEALRVFQSWIDYQLGTSLN